MRQFSLSRVGLPVALLVAALGTGCATVPTEQPAASCPDVNLPKELEKCSHPTYTVETPDILQINATRVIPLPPYRVEPLDRSTSSSRTP
jgi:hypothetical protein